MKKKDKEENIISEKGFIYEKNLKDKSKKKSDKRY